MTPAENQSADELRLVIDSLPGLVSYVDPQLRYKFANRAYAEWFCRKPGDLQGLSIPELVGPESFAEVSEYLASALKGCQQDFERRFRYRDAERHVRARYVPHFNAGGEVCGVLILVQDITAQTEAEHALRASEDQLRTVLANTPDIIARFDRQLRFVYISPAVEKVLGIPPAAHIGKRHHEVGLPPELSARLEASLEEIFITGERRTVTFEVPTPHGVRSYEGLGVPVTGSRGPVETVLTIVRDTTEQLNANQRLRESEARFRTIVETATEGIWIIDPEGITTFANERMCELLGCEPNSLVGQSCYGFLHPDELERGRSGVEARTRGNTGPVEYRVRRNDGKHIWMQFTAAPMRDQAGAITGILGMCTDVTERHERDALLRASEERYRSLVTATTSIVWTVSPAGVLTGDTGAWTVYTGMPVSSEPQGWRSFLHPDDVASAVHAWETAALQNGVLQHTARIWHHASGQYRWCVSRAVPLRNPDGTVREWIGTTTDVHDTREAEARYSALFNASRDGILIVDDNGAYVDVNPSYCALLKSSREDMLGRIFVPFIPEERLSDAVHAFETLKREGRYSGEFPLIAADGSRLELEWNSFANFVPGLHCCIARDITDRKLFERQLQQTQKLESLGVLAGGIAHDFNNLLVGMMGNASLAVDLVPPASPAQAMLSDVMKASDRAAQLTRQLLAYAGKARLATQPVDFSELVRELTGLLGATIPKTAHLRLQLSPDLLVVEGDPVQLQQVVMNLVINGAEAIPVGNPGLVTVSTSTRRMRPDENRHAIVPLPDSDAEYVVLTVSDTGSGMTAEVRDRIFDPFFTTKFQGRGLGLSAVLGIIRSHRGGLTLTSQIGKGTTFEVLLPRVQSAPEPAEQTSAADLSDKHSGTVLVVDDEPIVRSFLVRFLKRAGYQVVEASNGQEAIDIAAGDIPIHAIILDLAMPVLSGDKAAPQLRALRPDAAIILSSGYPEGEAVARFATAGITAFLQKPYTSGALLRKLADVTGRPATV